MWLEIVKSEKVDQEERGHDIAETRIVDRSKDCSME